MGNSFKKRRKASSVINYILKYGKLTRMDEIDEWLSAAQRKGKFIRVSGDIAGEFKARFWRSDRASLIALTQLPYFYDALLPHVSQDHEERLHWSLCRGINGHCPLSVLEMID